MPVAFSYLRFSSPQQAAGDSIRRQVEATADWCRRHKVRLDESLDLRDEGVSAFKGKHRENADVHGLAAFLAAVKTGRVPAGSFLVVENLDRLTRESIVPAVNLFTGILLAGVKIVQLRPAELVFTAGADMTAVMLALVELSRGNSESVMKSDRIGKAWAQKRKQAATKVLTRRTPTWITLADGKLVLDKAKAKVVRRLFAMAAEGTGLTVIARTLNEEGVPVLGRKVVACPGQAGVAPTKKERRPVVWSASVVYRILTSRAAVGEYQPHKGRPGDRHPDGPPIHDYYPAVIDPATFAAVQASLRRNATKGSGRRGRHVNIFAGLLRDARTGGNMMAHHYPRRESVILPAGATHGRGDRWVSFPLRLFEEAVRSELVEVKVEDIDPDAPAVNRAEGLTAQLAELDALIAKWRAKMNRPELVDVVADKLAELQRQHKTFAGQLAEAKREGETPLSEAVEHMRTVGKALADDNSDENRLRCRSAVRRAVDSVWCLFMPGRGLRVGAAQVWLRGGTTHRDYLVVVKAAGRNARTSWPARWWIRSFADTKLGAGDLDLRNRKHAAALEKVLVKAAAALTAEPGGGD